MTLQRGESAIPVSTIGKSLALHILIVLVFTVKTFFFPSEPVIFESAIRVDIVGLPDKKQYLEQDQITAPAPTPAPPKAEALPKVDESKTEPMPAPKPIPKTPPKENLKAAQRKALEKLKALEALSSIQDEVQEQSKPRGQAPIAGNAISQGGALKGIQQNQIMGYVSVVERNVKSNWDLPQWMSEAKLKAKAIMFIDKKGFVTKRMILTSSGNPTYDDLVLRAIDRSSPFPAPPAMFVDLFSTKGIQLGFPE
jgi:colicin import membrane protein